MAVGERDRHGCGPAVAPGGRPVPHPAVSGGDKGVVTGRAGGQAAGMQTPMRAVAVRVLRSPRPAPGKPCRALVFRSRCRFRSMTVRHLPRARSVPRREAAVMAAGRLAVAAPDRVLARTARRGGGEGDFPGGGGPGGGGGAWVCVGEVPGPGPPPGGGGGGRGGGVVVWVGGVGEQAEPLGAVGPAPAHGVLEGGVLRAPAAPRGPAGEVAVV